MLAVNHFLRKCLCDDIFCRWFSKNIICFPFFKHFVSSNNHIFKTVDGQWTIPLRKLFSCIFLVHFFFGTMLDRILELPLRRVQTKKSFNSCNKVFSFSFATFMLTNKTHKVQLGGNSKLAFWKTREV